MVRDPQVTLVISAAGHSLCENELPLRIIHETVREAARVTRRGGIFAIYDFTGTRDKSPYQRYHRWFDARHNGEPLSLIHI